MASVSLLIAGFLSVCLREASGCDRSSFLILGSSRVCFEMEGQLQMSAIQHWLRVLGKIIIIAIHSEIPDPPIELNAFYNCCVQL